MVSKDKFYATLVVLLLACICDGVTALHCYECNSHVDSRCKDNVPPSSMKKDCNELSAGSKYTFCRKILQQVEFSVNGMPPDLRIVRSCGWDESKYKGQCYERSGLGGAQTVCSCYGDACNGATPRSVLSPPHLLLAIVASIFGKMLVV